MKLQTEVRNKAIRKLRGFRFVVAVKNFSVKNSVKALDKESHTFLMRKIMRAYIYYNASQLVCSPEPLMCFHYA